MNPLWVPDSLLPWSPPEGYIGAMSANEVMAQIKALPQAEQEKLGRLLLEETDWLEDWLDAAIAQADGRAGTSGEMLLREY